MKYKRIIFILFLLSLTGLMCLFVFAEKEVLPISTWDRTYGGSNDDMACSLIQTTDGGYAVAGATSSKGAGELDFWVIKLDSQGNMIWDRTYGGSGEDEAQSLIQTTDGGYAVAGDTYSKGAGNRDFWVIKLDHQGDMIWDKTYGGSAFDLAYSLIQTTDGGYAVAGVTSSKGQGGADFWVIKLDHQGDMIWDRTHGGSDEDYAYSLIQTTDGGYAVAGVTYSKGAGKSDFWVIKLDYQGNMIWDRSYGGSGTDWMGDYIQTTDGGYAVAGATSSKGAGELDFWVIKLDSQGNMIWDRTYGGSGEDEAYSLIQTTDGGYAVAGVTSSKGAGDRDFWVIKLNYQGNMIWDKTYGGIAEDRAFSLIQTTDGGYAVAGYTYSTYSKGAGSYDFWVIKLDAQGKPPEKVATRIQPMQYPWKSIIISRSMPPQGLALQGKVLEVNVDLGGELSPSELETLAKRVKLIDENGREYPCFGRSSSEGAMIKFYKDGKLICLFEADIAYGFMFEVGSEPSNYSLLWPDYPPFAVGNPLDTTFCSTQ